MSLLNRGNTEVIVFREEMVVDEDGNRVTRPSKTGIPCQAVIQPVNSSIQPPGSGERQDEGFETTELYRMRLVGWEFGVLGAQSAIEWEGRRYAVQGEVKRFRGSPRTAHDDFTLLRR